MVSGDPSYKPVYAYIILRVDIQKPDALDITGYQHSFWPGEVVLDPEDYGAQPKTLEYHDDPITFVTTLQRVAIGQMRDGRPTFPDDTNLLLQQLEHGRRHEAMFDDFARTFTESAKEKLDELMGTGEFDMAGISDALDRLQREVVRGIRMK